MGSDNLTKYGHGDPFYRTPFHAKLEVAAGTFSAEIVEECQPHDTATDLAVPGADLEYRILMLQVSANVGVNVTILNTNGDLWGLHSLPAGFGAIPMGPAGLPCGLNLQPKITAAATAGGNWTGRIDLFGVKVPNQVF